MLSYLKQSTASQTRILGPFLDDTDGTTAETGLTIANTDIKLSANGGSSANKNSGGGTHIVNGNYAVTFDATDTATVGELQVSCKMSGALQVVAKFVVLEEAVYDALFGASAAGYVAAGDLPTNFADLAITSSTGKVTVGTNDDKTGYSLTPTTGLGNQTADITGNLSGSVGSVTGAVGSVLGGINTSAGTITTLDGLDTAQDTQHSTTQSAIAGLNDLSTSDIDARLAAYDGPTNTQMVAAFTEIKGGTWSSTDTLEAISTQLGMVFEDTNESLPLELSAISGYIDTEVAAIKAVTDAIPDSGAMTSIAQESTVSGLSFSTFDVSSDTVITASIYTARVDLTIDGANSQDEYTVQWLKNGAPVAVTGTPQIQVVKRADGTDLIAATNMTQIGSVNGAYKYDENTSRITAGEAVLITCTATIDASVRTWTVPLARDSS